MSRSSLTLDILLESLNAPQREAVTHRDGPLLVLAGPGSGKTRVITSRAAHLVYTGVDPRQILAITFTNKAADEMRKRIESFGVGRGMWVYTFHALGARLLREFGALARIQPGFSIYDTDDQKRLIKQAMKVADISADLIKPDRIQQRISGWKNQLKRPAELLDHTDFFDVRAAARVYDAYEQLLEQNNAVDFDDLLLRVALVLRDHPEHTARLNERFRYVLIDEYQDTNHAQYLIARYLSQQHQNICATGDPDQSIYGWRGADIGNILEFERDYPAATIVRLEQNYRSTGHILRAASQLIRCNRKRKHKDLWSESDDGAAVSVWEFDSGRDEANHVAQKIASAHAEGRPLSDFAIMYRINAASRELEEALRMRGLAYRIARGVEFYSRREIRDTLAYLRVLVNPLDEVALLRIINTPTRGIGKTSIERLQRAAAQRAISLWEALRDPEAAGLKKAAAGKVRKFVALIERLSAAPFETLAERVSETLIGSGLEADLLKEAEEGGEDRLANVEELASAAARFEEEVEGATLEQFLQRISLVSDQDQVDESAGVVMLMTLHAAKGLEFPTVFLVGLEQGMLPHERSLSEGDVEEERRLCFVGITRAMRELYLSHVAQRTIRGMLLPRARSQFLEEIGEEGLERRSYRTIDNTRTIAREDDDGLWEDHDADEEWDDDSASTALRGKRRGLRPPAEPVYSLDDPTGAPRGGPAASAFGGWTPGMFVKHASYGVGQIVWIRPSEGNTRARVRFAGDGEKTFVLELTPITKLERRRP